MIRPATAQDLFVIVPDICEEQSWLELLLTPNLEEVLQNNKAMVVVQDDVPVFCFGVGRLKLSSAVVPWIWGVYNTAAKVSLLRLAKEDKEAAIRHLTEHAPGGYTAPERDDLRYTKFLRYMGFRHLGWGLWQCPSLAKQ